MRFCAKRRSSCAIKNDQQFQLHCQWITLWTLGGLPTIDREGFRRIFPMVSSTSIGAGTSWPWWGLKMSRSVPRTPSPTLLTRDNVLTHTTLLQKHYFDPDGYHPVQWTKVQVFFHFPPVSPFFPIKHFKSTSFLCKFNRASHA
jgi:hypothetical protein